MKRYIVVRRAIVPRAVPKRVTSPAVAVAQKMNWNGQKIHLGCGNRRLRGWINIDIRPGPSVDVLLDYTKNLPIPARSIERIYWSHGPEHIHPDRLPGVFNRLRQVLRPAGRMIVATIDFESIYKNRYLTNRNGNNWNLALYGGANSNDDPVLNHKICFSEPLLRSFLEKSGLRNIRRWRPEDYPDILALNDCAVASRLVTIHMEGFAP